MSRRISLAAGMAATLVAAVVTATAAYGQEPKHPTRRVAVRSSGGSFLGLGVAEIDAERAKALNLKEEYGVEVKSVQEDSPAAKAGLKEGDVVLEYNGQRVEGDEQFVRLVRETPVGRQVKLVIWRGGATQTLTATIGSRPPGTYVFGGNELEFPLPRIEFHMPDIPRPLMSWQIQTLGVETEPLGSQLAEFFGVKQGVLVRSVVKGSAAEKAGVKAGDIIVKVDDQSVASPKEISSALRSLKSKKTFPLTVVRSHKETTLSVTLDESSSLERPRRTIRMERMVL